MTKSAPRSRKLTRALQTLVFMTLAGLIEFILPLSDKMPSIGNRKYSIRGSYQDRVVEVFV